jgi:hypothetical protein
MQNGVTKVKRNINSVGVHLLLSHNGHLVGDRSLNLVQPVSAMPFENSFSWLIDGGEGGRGGFFFPHNLAQQ